MFAKFARLISDVTSQPLTFGLACLLILTWGLTGPIFGFSDTWQLVINTGTTIVTFLMVFLIQNTQNREATAVQVKLDELILAIKGAHNRLLDLEDVSADELQSIQTTYKHVGQESKVRPTDTEARDIDLVEQRLQTG